MQELNRKNFLTSLGGLTAAAAVDCGCVSRWIAERPLLKVGFFSDTHIGSTRESCARVGLGLQLFRRENVDLVAHIGDLADVFTASGYEAYRAVFDETFAKTAKRPREIYLFAAHDGFSYPDASRRYSRNYAEALEAFTAMKGHLKIPHAMDDIVEVGGYPFVVCSSWQLPRDYEALVAKAYRKYPTGPIFVLDHIPAFGTVANSWFWGNEQRRKILDRYPRVVHVSGHNHAFLRNEANFWQGTFTAVNDGSMSYWGHSSGTAVGGVVTGKDWGRIEAFDAMTMEVYLDRLVFHRWDVQTGAEYRPENPWTATLPFEASRAEAREAARRAAECVPQFAPGAALSFVRGANGDYVLSFPEAAGETRAWSYRVDLAQGGAEGKWLTYARQDFAGDFFRRAHERTGVASRTISGALVDPSGRVCVTVTPVGQLGVEGRPISLALVTDAEARWQPIFLSTKLGENWQVTDSIWDFKSESAATPDAEGWFVSPEKRRYWSVEPKLPADAKKGDRFAVVVEAELEGEVDRTFHIALDNPFGTAFISDRGKVPWQRYAFEFTLRQDGERHAVGFCSMGPARFRPSVVKLFRYVAADPSGLIRTEDLRIRDPYVVTDKAAGKYYLYRANPWEAGGDVDVYESRDLKFWARPSVALRIDPAIGHIMTWAPEVHFWRGRWYMLVTLTLAHARGTWAFVADSPKGPYRAVSDRALTPRDWRCLDGTFFEQDGKPYLVFCHEWCQTGDGKMIVAEVKPDFTGLAGAPVEIFRATSVGEKYRITDGPFLYRSPKSGKLFMTWSNGGPGGYTTYLKVSASGTVKGPWVNHGTLFENDGGHGMFFRKLDDTLAYALHRPNTGPAERLAIFDVDDAGDTLRLRDARQ